MDLNGMSFDEIKVLADGLGMTYHPNIGEAKLKEKVERFVEDNPGCLGEDSEDVAEESKPKEIIKENLQEIPKEVVPEVKPPETKAVKGKVKIKSEFVGEISSRHGVIDFGTDGIVELEPEVAEYFCSLPYGYSKC